MVSEGILIIVIMFAVLLGGSIGFLIGERRQMVRATMKLQDKAAEVARLEASLIGERRAADERCALIEHARKTLADQFAALSGEALARNNAIFLDIAQEKMARFHEVAKSDMETKNTAITAQLKPVSEALAKFENQIRAIELDRKGAYEGLRQQSFVMQRLFEENRNETKNLVRALRTSQTRGRWGEIQLKRVVELAGMLDHCDFFEQPSLIRQSDNEPQRLRPDLVVRMPGGKHIAVDAKTPLDAFLDANSAEDESVRRQRLADHARHVREHIRKLAGKTYWNDLPGSLEFVVLFLPGEHLFAAALQEDPGILEFGVKEQVFVASPTSLIVMLRAAYHGWQQEALIDNVRAIADEGKQLYKCLTVMGQHIASVGKGLTSTVANYNKAVASFESRLAPSARRLAGLAPSEVTKNDMDAIQQIDILPRETSLT